jgi:N-acetylglucosaminyldiphosphoundecaprenol N-acetyl-beta-D-mannosaminyltransferase
MLDLHHRQFSLDGIRIDGLNHNQLLSLIDDARVSQRRLLILHHNLHSLYLHETDPSFASAYKHASWAYIDGMPVVWLGRALGLPLTSADRITFLDCFEAILAESAKRGWRVFYLGSSEESLIKGITLLRHRHPDLVIEGRNGFFLKHGTPSHEIVQAINEYRPDIVFVGMGMPVQETWLAKYFSMLDTSAVLSSGATMDYISGYAYKPPRWAGRLGLYGVFRLFLDPKRLWRRYLIEPIFLLRVLSPRLLRQLRIKDMRQT